MRNDPRGHSKYRRIAKSVVGKGKPCYWGYPGCTGIATQADHLIPVSKDPSRAKDRSLMVPSCAHCNQSKGNRATPRVQRDVAWRRSVFSTQRNHIPVHGQFSLPMRRYALIRGDFSRREAGDGAG
jgi:5-methylcytosine-specific restriction endonuclease McrA